MSMFLYGFGLFGHNIEQIKELEEDLQNFRNAKNEAVCTVFLGAVNHWVTVLLHKTRENPEKVTFYLLDSSNSVHLDKSDEQIPDILEQRSREKEALGMK